MVRNRLARDSNIVEEGTQSRLLRTNRKLVDGDRRYGRIDQIEKKNDGDADYENIGDKGEGGADAAGEDNE